MKLTIDLPQFVIDRIKNNYDYDVPVILNAVDKALSEKASKDEMTFCEECKYLKDCELAKHEEVDTCKKGEKRSD